LIFVSANKKAPNGQTINSSGNISTEEDLFIVKWEEKRLVFKLNFNRMNYPAASYGVSKPKGTKQALGN